MDNKVIVPSKSNLVNHKFTEITYRSIGEELLAEQKWLKGYHIKPTVYHGLQFTKIRAWGLLGDL